MVRKPSGSTDAQAMGNALPEVKDAAHFVTEALDRDGVAVAIERFVL